MIKDFHKRWPLDTIDVARDLANVLEEKKGENILLLDIHEYSDFADFFLICSGTSDRMLNALADTVVDRAREQFDLRGRLEGTSQDGWLLIDYGDLIIHLFSPDRRSYYRLEELWGRGKVVLRLQ